jgi:Rhodopirellula transposase DDE domain
MIDEDAIRQRWSAVGSKLDERGQRLFAAVEVRTAGWGGLAIVSKITGLARSTINRGKTDLDGEPLPKGQVRRAGGGRRAVCENDPGLVPALERLVEPATLGDPMRPLIWVSKSMEKLAATLTEMGHPISADTVRKELVKLGFSRQSNRKADEGSKHPDRNAQFEHINAKVIAAQAQQQPVISVDTKKKELIGNFKNGGTDYRPKGNPRRVNVHDFEDKRLGKVVPYGVYDVTANAGFVSVGITSDTAEFAVSVDPLLARTHGTTALSEGTRIDDHGRLRRLEWGACAALEGRAAKARRRDGARSVSTTIRRARRSGTRSSTGCSATSRRTGAAGRSRIALPWSN